MNYNQGSTQSNSQLGQVTSNGLHPLRGPHSRSNSQYKGQYEYANSGIQNMNTSERMEGGGQLNADQINQQKYSEMMAQQKQSNLTSQATQQQREYEELAKLLSSNQSSQISTNGNRASEEQKLLICDHFINSRGEQEPNIGTARTPYAQCTSRVQIGDAHLLNCNKCGAFQPKSGAMTIRSKNRRSQMSKVYSSDILRTMYSQCVQKTQVATQVVKISHSYQEVRQLIIDWLCEVSETLKLSQRTVYHAVNILDRFLSQQHKKVGIELEQSLIMLQGLACLFISAKNYEMDPTVPSSRKFLRQLPGYQPTQRERRFEQDAYRYGMQHLNGQGNSEKFDAKKNELCEQEQYILNTIEFDLDCYPVFFDIVEIFMAQGILFSSDQMQQGGQLEAMIPDSKCVNLLEKYIDFFSLLSLQDHKIVNTNQYLVACSIVSACRKHCKINPVWSKELVQLTGLQQAHFTNIEKRIIQKFELQYHPQASKGVKDSQVSENPSTNVSTQQETITSQSQNMQQKPQQPQTSQVARSNSSQKQEDSFNIVKISSDVKVGDVREQNVAQNEVDAMQRYRDAVSSQIAQGAQSQLTRVPYNTQASESTQPSQLTQPQEATRQQNGHSSEKENMDNNQKNQLANTNTHPLRSGSGQGQSTQPSTSHRYAPSQSSVNQQSSQRTLQPNDHTDKLQKSKVFQKLVQNQKNKYEQKIENEKDDLQNSNKVTSRSSAGGIPKQKNEQRIIKQPTAEDYESRQQQLRVKYGSNKTKQQNNYYSSRMQEAMPKQNIVKNSIQSTKHSSSKQNTSSRNNQRTSSNSSALHQNRHSLVSQASAQSQHKMNRQRSSGSVNAGPAGGYQSGLISSRLMSGTASSNIRKHQISEDSSKRVGHYAKPHTSVYNRQMSMVRQQLGTISGSGTGGNPNGRSTSVASSSSIGYNRPGRAVGNPSLQNSEAKSLVRCALKNQKRGEKVAGTAFNVFQTSESRESSQGVTRPSYQQQQPNSRYNQRLRVNSGVPFLRAGAGGGGGAVHPSSNCEKPVDFRNQRASSNLSRGGSNSRMMISSASKNSMQISGQHITSGGKLPQQHVRDHSVNSQNSHGSGRGGQFQNGLRNHAYQPQQITTTSPNNQQLKLGADGQYIGGSHDVLVQNYNAFQQRINEMKARTEALVQDDRQRQMEMYQQQ